MTDTIVLRNYGLIDPENSDENIARKGCTALEKALKNLTPEKVIQEIENSGLRKREGKGLPVAEELILGRRCSSHKKYVVCNTTEWDPASSINKKIIESDPLSIIEGMGIVAYAIGSAVGYIYYQITGDSGDGAILGDFKSRIYSIGPQVGYIFKIGERQAYLNLKGYWEFGAENRPEGWNAWLTLVLPLGGGSK